MGEVAPKRPSPIAASHEAKATLKRLVKSLGLPQLALLDQIVKAAGQHVDAHGGRMLIPFSFDLTFQVRPWGHEVLDVPPSQQKSRARSKIRNEAR